MQSNNPTEIQDQSNDEEYYNKLKILYNRLVWHCEPCDCIHILTSNTILCPFNRKHGFRIVDVASDGDCFYTCIVECLSMVGGIDIERVGGKLTVSNVS